MMVVAMAVRDEEFAVMLAGPECGTLEAQRLVQSDSRPGHSTKLLGSPPGSQGRVEDLENRRVRRKRLAGRSSFDFNRQSIDEIHSWESSDDPPSPLHPPLWNRSQANCAVAFAKWAETSGVHVITTHPYSVCRGGASSDALWRSRSLMEIQKRGRWRSEKSVGRYEKHVRLLKETAKLSTATRKYGQLVVGRMPQLLEGAQPPLPPVLTKLVRSLA